MNAAGLIWAVDADLIITIAIVLFGIIIPLVLNVVNKLKEAQGNVGGAGPRPARPRPADPDVEDEIGEFLRRAAGRRQGQPEPAARPVRPARRVADEQAAEAVVLEPVPQHRDVAEQVAHDIDTRKFEERARQAQRRAAQARRKAQQRTQKAFDHEVGHLQEPGPQPARGGQRTSVFDDQSEQVAAGLAAGLPALLRNTNNLRQAIVINEVLQRPEHRW